MSSEPRVSPIHSDTNKNGVYKRERPSRACTARSAARIYEAAVAEAAVVVAVRKHKLKSRRRRKEVVEEEEEEEEEEEQPPSPPNPYSDVVTKLVGEPPPSQLPRWDIRSMWELASILNFLNVFRPLLNIKVEFSVEELETALITPNNTLGEIHIPLLKAIPPVTRMALGQNTWVTVLCRKLKDWWHWVSEGELPIVASHGAEIDTYNTLDPGVRVVILKALCDIRVEQDDIRSYIDDSIKHGVPLSAFRKERTGGDSRGVSFWYEDDPIIGQRLYREIRKTEVKKGKGKNVHSISSCQWETVSTNLDEFQDVSEKLLSSKNRTETSLGKKLKNDMLPEIEKVQKRKEKLLKKQHREALLLDGMILDGLGPGRSLRGRKQVSYTFDAYDRSISEAIKITKRKHPSPEPSVRREGLRHGNSTNGKWGGGTGPAPSPNRHNTSFTPASPDSLNEYETDNEDEKSEQLDRSDRTRQRPQRYSAREFVEAVSDNEAGMDSDYKVDDDDDDDIVGEAVYDEEYLKKRKERKKMSSSSEGDEEYRWDGDKSEEEEEDEGEESLSASEDSEESPRRSKKLSGRTRRGTKIRSVREVKSRPRRSRRATRIRIDYNQYQFSDSEPESAKPETSNSEKSGFSMGTSDDDTEAENDDNNNDENNFDDENEVDKENEIDNENNIDNEDEDDDNENENEENVIDEPDEPVTEEHQKVEEHEQNETPMKLDSPVEDDEFENGARKRRFLDLNELAPGSGFEDGQMNDDDNDNF